ncbi:Outer membrane lipoprotein Blc [Pandoraea anapnoica]|uniref:Outer membrane lipoprotein Blc n=1 Tax=Pandoraea anapnoica TaxID=2508301 RepID=A0A5E4ZYC9_9BURK|nr:lipocalin family protein [Pandoraea anapnoica]VVE65285.1 Outer membrane lipoprotein Blc [Pandoraea anapnoica]
MTRHSTPPHRLATERVAVSLRTQRAAPQSTRRRWFAVAVLACAALTSCSGAPPNPNPLANVPLKVASVDLPRYMGRWYVIANIPYFAERDFVASRAEWVLREDGRIDDHFYGRKGGFDQPESHYQFLDSVLPGTGGGHWRVRLFWPIYVSQLTLYVDPDYRYTLLGYPDKSLGWVFSREPTMDDATYRLLLTRLEAMGYDTSRFRRVPQMPEQLGQPGFVTPGRED